MPSIIGDLESHPESEIFDKEDYLSNRSLFDFSNIQDYDYEEDEPYEETKQDIEGDEDLENALNRVILLKISRELNIFR